MLSESTTQPPQTNTKTFYRLAQGQFVYKKNQSARKGQVNTIFPSIHSNLKENMTKKETTPLLTRGGGWFRLLGNPQTLLVREFVYRNLDHACARPSKLSGQCIQVG